MMTLAGWGQPHDALSVLCPDATPIDYAGYANVGDALSAIAAEGRKHDTVVGWSLGGQLAVRAIAAGMMRPKRLVLIAAPYQFVETPELKVGMKRDLYDKFRHNYANNPGRTLDKSWALVALDDSREEAVRARLEQQDKAAVLQHDWLSWLDALNDYSCEGLNMTGFPPVLLVHGARDMVVSMEQSRYFSRQLPHAELRIVEGCGHAPHWHDTAAISAQINEFAHV